MSIGNTTNDGSFNNTGGEDGRPRDGGRHGAVLTDRGRGRSRRIRLRVAGAAVETAVDAIARRDSDASVQESVAPAEDPLAADLTAADTYESSDAGGVVVEEPYVEEPAEEQ